MASPRGTILPVSYLTFHSLMCLHLEAAVLLGESGAASRERDREHSRPLVRERLGSAALQVLSLCCLDCSL